MTIHMWGGNAPSSYQSADGSWFTAVNIPKAATFAVYREYPDGRTELVELDGREDGQGQLCLQADGRLFAVVGETTGNTAVRRIEVPGYVSPRTAQAPATSDAPALELTPAIAALWRGAYGPSDLDTPDEIAVRVTKLKAAVLEIIDQLAK